MVNTIKSTDIDPTFKDSVEIAKLLIDDKRKNINAVDWNGETTLIYAIQYQPKVVEIWIENNAIDVNVQDHFGETVLDYAAQSQTIYDENTRVDVFEATKKLLHRN